MIVLFIKGCFSFGGTFRWGLGHLSFCVEHRGHQGLLLPLNLTIGFPTKLHAEDGCHESCPERSSSKLMQAIESIAFVGARIYLHCGALEVFRNFRFRGSMAKLPHMQCYGPEWSP